MSQSKMITPNSSPIRYTMLRLVALTADGLCWFVRNVRGGPRSARFLILLGAILLLIALPVWGGLTQMAKQVVYEDLWLAKHMFRFVQWYVPPLLVFIGVVSIVGGIRHLKNKSFQEMCGVSRTAQGID